MVSRVILIGFMGSGKTTLGKKLAHQLNYQFIDTDKIIELKEGLTISQLFEQKGEAYFRELEKNLLNELSTIDFAVISVGGGLPCFNDNMKILLELGAVFYLERSAKELFQRVKNNISQRPLLADKTETELLSYIEDSLKKRTPYYQQAHFILDRNSQTAQHLLSYIKNL
jgi:shikimate kinase